jgi:hypothetical protein
MKIRGRLHAGAVNVVMLVVAVSCLGRTTTNGGGRGGTAGAAGHNGSADTEAGLGGAAAAGGGALVGGGGSAAGGSAAASDGGVTDAASGCPWSQCTMRACNGMVLQCGDCFDNDGDGLLDGQDPDCLGPCDNDEAVWDNSHSSTGCSAECFFYAENWVYGSDDDECIWGYQCDPLTVPPYYDELTSCQYNPDAGVYGTSATCSELMTSQPGQCLATCGPLVPNGCDCFGCCNVPQAPTAIRLGSEWYEKPCTKETAADPMRCKPCTIVPSCFNPCEKCELCLGKTSLPPECGSLQQCPPGAQRCGLPEQSCCPADTYCITGCCQPVPKK